MNRYYLVLLKLYKQSMYKQTMKEIWGKKINYIRASLAVMSLSGIGIIVGFILSLSQGKLALYLLVFSYLGILLSAVAAFILVHRNKDDIKQREYWLIEINQFNRLLNDYEFDDKAIERMIIYIDEYRTKKFIKSKRKFDVFWGIISVTFFSFTVSIGGSIWDSYEFKGDEALKYGTLLVIIIILCVILLLAPFYVIYDSVVKIPKDEEGLKRALQEVIFSRSVKMIVTKENISEILIEDDVNNAPS